jgi:hypothetical protein
MPLTRRQFLASSAILSAQTPSPQKPNVLLILADDLAAWMLGC